MEKINEILSLNKEERNSEIFKEIENCNEEFVECLLKNSFKFSEILDDEGNTLLHKIAISGNEKAFVPIANEFFIDVRNTAGLTPLHYAVKKNNLSFVKLLISNGANIINDFSGVSPLQIAEENNNTHISKLLRKRMKGIKASFTKISSLITSQSYDELRKLIEDGEYMNIRDTDGLTLLHCAVSIGDLEAVKLLINSVEINAKDSHKRTATQISIDMKKLEVTKFLVMNGGISYAESEEEAVKEEKEKPKSRYIDIFKAIDDNNRKDMHRFMKEATNVNLINENEQTPLLYAMTKGELKYVSILANKKTVNHIDNKGLTPIFFAIRDRNPSLARILVEKGANVMYKDPQGDDVISIVSTWKDEEERNVMLLELSMGLFNGPWRFLNFINANSQLFHERKNDYLLEAIKRDNSEIIVILIEKKVDINQIINETSPLHYAIECGSEKAVSILLKSGAGLVSINGVNELDKALTAANPSKYIIRRIVSSYLSEAVNLIDEPQSFIDFLPKKILTFPNSYFLLRAAIDKIQLSVVKHLIDNGLSAKCLGENGETMLHFAAQKTQLSTEERGKLLEIIIYLIDNGADKFAIDSNGRTPLHYASEVGYPEIVAELAHKCLCELADAKGKTPIDLAANKETSNVLTIICSRIAEDSLLPEDDEDKMKRIIEKSTTISTDVINVCIKKDYSNLIQKLINKGVDPNTCDTNETYLMHHCVFNNSFNSCRILLLNGANVNVTDKKGRTPLHLAVINDNEQIAKMLIDCGAKNYRDLSKKKAVDYASEDSKTYTLMKEYQLFCRVVKHLGESKYEDELDNIAQRFGFLLLEKAIIKGDSDLIRKLVTDYHISPMISNPFGVTALHVACMYKASARIVKTLLELGCNKDAKTIIGFTPLHFAAMSNSKEAVKVLVKDGANTKAVNKNKKTPAGVAKAHGHTKLLKYLGKK